MSERRLIGDPILEEVLPPVLEFDNALALAAAKVADHSMAWDESVGLAANQIGLRERLFVIKLDGKLNVYVNPSIIRHSYTMLTEVEGCGSIPDRYFRVSRPGTIVARWQTLQGQVKAEQMHDMKARVYQHELGHLNGVLISDIGEEVFPEPEAE